MKCNQKHFTAWKDEQRAEGTRTHAGDNSLVEDKLDHHMESKVSDLIPQDDQSPLVRIRRRQAYFVDARHHSSRRHA